MKCDKCGVKFTWKQSYDQHVSTCVGMNKFQCKDCENIIQVKKFERSCEEESQDKRSK